MVVASLIKELQVSTELRRMGEIGLLPQETVTNLISSKFESNVEEGEENDSLVRGEFDVIKELMEKLPGAVEGKKKLDRVIDLCGPSPKGSGLQNLRECILWTEEKFNFEPKLKKVCKTMTKKIQR